MAMIIIALVAMLVLGGMLMMGDSLERQEETSGIQVVGEPDLVVEDISETPEVAVPLSDSTDLDDIETDLQASGLEDLDAELEAIESELNF